MWWILSWDLLTGHCKNKLVYTTVKYFKMATPSNVNKTINEEKITPDAKRVKLFSGVWCWKNGLNIWHCQLRNEASSLNHHLFQSHLSNNSQCACGDAIENNFHYFYVCPLFIRHRIQLFLFSKKVSRYFKFGYIIERLTNPYCREEYWDIRCCSPFHYW